MNSVFCSKVLTAILIIGLLASPASVYAQKKVYKWVDEEGIVHYGEEPPAEAPEVDVKTFTTDPAPPYVAPAQTTVKSQPASAAGVEKKSAQPEMPVRPPVKETNIKEMSLADLDRRCEDAREERIAPLKKAEIANCLKTETGDQAWCETFWADYGASRQTASGGFVQGEFYDLPECVDAFEERNHRGLYPGGNP